jgi:hypothetical protein
MRRKLGAVVAVLGIGGVLAISAGAGADSTKTCTEQGKNKNWTVTVVQQSACPSNPPGNPGTTTAVVNGGGNTPNGQQP